MRDDQKRSLLADGGKGEAVRFQSPLDGRWITAPQVECAPREAQPEPESACNPADICAGCRCEYSQSAAPTPERAQESYWQKAAETLERANVELSCAYVELKKKLRAQESAGVLTDDEIMTIWGMHEYQEYALDFARAVLAKKEGA
jgi:hypothetical protein